MASQSGPLGKILRNYELGPVTFPFQDRVSKSETVRLQEANDSPMASPT